MGCRGGDQSIASDWEWSSIASDNTMHNATLLSRLPCLKSVSWKAQIPGFFRALKRSCIAALLSAGLTPTGLKIPGGEIQVPGLPWENRFAAAAIDRKNFICLKSVKEMIPRDSLHNRWNWLNPNPPAEGYFLLSWSPKRTRESHPAAKTSACPSLLQAAKATFNPT